MPATLFGRLSCLLFASLLACCGCQANSAKPPAPKPAEVIVSTAVTKKIIDYEDFTGTLEAYKKIDITSRVTGYLEKVNFKEGGFVQKGQMLFEIDPRPAKAELDKAEAAVVQAEARFHRLQGDYQRAQELVRSRSISKEEFEKVAGDHEEAKAAVGVANASRKSALLNYDYTKVLSPIDGRAGRSMLDEGNLIKADNTILTTVVTQDPVFAYFDVDERTLLKLRRIATSAAPKSVAAHVRVTLGLADEDGFPHVGKVDFEDNTIERATGTQRLRGVFANKSGLFAPGMFVRIRFQVGEPRTVVVVKEQGVRSDQGQKYVYVVDSKNDIEDRKIKTGPLEDGWRVVEEGISAGDRIVVSGLQRVRDKMKVDPREEPIPAAKVVHETTVRLPKDAK